MANGERRIGRVKMWKKSEGYGFISNPEGQDVFVHYSVVPGPKKDKNLVEGDVVEYYEGSREDGLYAISIVEVRRS